MTDREILERIDKGTAQLMMANAVLLHTIAVLMLQISPEGCEKTRACGDQLIEEVKKMYPHTARSLTTTSEEYNATH